MFNYKTNFRVRGCLCLYFHGNKAKDLQWSFLLLLFLSIFYISSEEDKNLTKPHVRLNKNSTKLHVRHNEAIFPIKNGYLSILNEFTDAIYINVGLQNSLDGYDRLLRNNKNAALIGFEPQKDKIPNITSDIANRTLLLNYAISNVSEPQ